MIGLTDWLLCASLLAQSSPATTQEPARGTIPPAGVIPAPATATAPTPSEAGGSAQDGLAMSRAVACLRVDGLERYTPLPDATLTNADKLKVYFRPIRYKVETDPKQKSPYRAKFVEDGRIRRKGEKAVLAKEDKLLEYETRFDAAEYQIYLVNTIGLDKLPPGDYEFDITLHDMIDGTATARQSLPFTIVAGPANPIATGKPAAPPTPPAGKARKSSGATRPPKRPG